MASLASCVPKLNVYRKRVVASSMKWLFIHQNFPGQYLHVVRHVARAGEEVIGIGQKRSICSINGVRSIEYVPAQPASTAHEYVREFDLAVQNGLAGLRRECDRFKSEIVPDIVVGHEIAGRDLFLR